MAGRGARTYCICQLAAVQGRRSRPPFPLLAWRLRIEVCRVRRADHALAPSVVCPTLDLEAAATTADVAASNSWEEGAGRYFPAVACKAYSGMKL